MLSVGEEDGGGGEDRQREEMAVSVLHRVCACVCLIAVIFDLVHTSFEH